MSNFSFAAKCDARLPSKPSLELIVDRSRHNRQNRHSRASSPFLRRLRCRMRTRVRERELKDDPRTSGEK